MSDFAYVNLLNLSLSFITFVFTLSFLVSFIVFRKKIQDKFILGAVILINLLLFVYSILSFYEFYVAGFFSEVIYELVTFDHDLLAVLTIIPAVFMIVKAWRGIPKILVAFYVFVNIVNGFFLFNGNYLASVMSIFFILLSGSYIGLFAALSKKKKDKN